MRKLAGLVVVLAALILGSYYGMGIITERTLKKNIAMMDQSNGVFIEMEQYHRGLYRSTALLNWRIQIPERTIKNQEGVDVIVPAKDYKMQVPIDIYHGPVMIVGSKPMFGLGFARSQVTLSKTNAEELAKTYSPASIVPVLNLRIFVNYVNSSSLDVNIPAFKLITKEGNSQLEWSGMTSNVDITSSTKQVNGHVTIDGIHFQKEKMIANLGKVVSDFDLHQTNLDMYMGKGNVSFSSFIVMQDDKKTLDVQNLDVHSTNDIHDGLFSAQVKLTLAHLLSADKIYGPASLDVSLNNLDAEILAKINRQANELQQQGSNADHQKALLMLMPELPKLLAKGARLEVSEASVTMPEGIIKGNLLISLPAEGTDNPFQLIQKMKGQGKIMFSAAVLKQLMNTSVKQSLQKQAALQASIITPVPDNAPDPEAATAPASAVTAAPEAEVPAPKVDDQETIAKQADEKLANMVQSGLLSLQGSDYVVDFKLAEGKLEINGKPFDSAMMSF